MNKLKIVFINLYSQKVERGAESFAHELARRLETDYQITFIKGDSELLPTNNFKGSLVQKISKRLFLDKPGRQVLAFTWHHLNEIRKAKPDIVIPLNGFWQVLLLKILQPFCGYKMVITGHSGPGWDERFNLYLHPNTFVATTKPTLEWARKTAPWTKSILIPYGIDPKALKELSQKYSLKAEKKPLVLCPSALVPYKRVDLAIKAVARLEKVNLLVLGKGPLKVELKSIGQELLRSRFELKASPYEHMPMHYARADVVTLPSESQENSPMVFVEALAMNKPVITTDTPRNRWMLGEAGVYIDPTDADSYAWAIHEALETKFNTSKPLKKFLWSNVLLSYEQLFANLVSKQANN